MRPRQRLAASQGWFGPVCSLDRLVGERRDRTAAGGGHRAGLDHRLPLQASLKNLRHTHATLLLANGVPPKVIQERLGYSQISITLDTYPHAIPAMHVEATAKAAALIDG